MSFQLSSLQTENMNSTKPTTIEFGLHSQICPTKYQRKYGEKQTSSTQHHSQHFSENQWPPFLEAFVITYLQITKNFHVIFNIPWVYHIHSLCNHHNHLILEHFHQPKRNSTHKRSLPMVVGKLQSMGQIQPATGLKQKKKPTS